MLPTSINCLQLHPYPMFPTHAYCYDCNSNFAPRPHDHFVVLNCTLAPCLPRAPTAVTATPSVKESRSHLLALSRILIPCSHVLTPIVAATPTVFHTTTAPLPPPINSHQMHPDRVLPAYPCCNCNSNCKRPRSCLHSCPELHPNPVFATYACCIRPAPIDTLIPCFSRNDTPAITATPTVYLVCCSVRRWRRRRVWQQLLWGRRKVGDWIRSRCLQHLSACGHVCFWCSTR